MHNRPFTVILTEGTGDICLLGVGECIHSVQADKGRCKAFLHLFLRDKGRPDGAHQPRIGGPGHISSDILLHGAENRIIFKGSALHHDPLPQGADVGDADHLGKYILYNGTAQSGHDIFRILAVSLFRDDTAVHKYRTAASQRCRRAGGECRPGDSRHGDGQGSGEVLQKRTAPGGAGLIDDDVCDYAMVQPDGFHILSADIQQKRGVPHIAKRCLRVGHRLHHVAFRLHGVMKQHLPVSGGTGCQDLQNRPFGPVSVPECQQSLLRHNQGFSFIIGIEGVQDLFLLAHEDKFGCGASGIDAQICADMLSL